MNSSGAMPKVTARAIVQLLTSTNSVRISRRPEPARPASAASSEPPSTVLTNSRWIRKVTTQSTWKSQGGPGSGAGSSAGIRLLGMACLRDVRRLQAQEVAREGIDLGFHPDERWHQRVIELLGGHVPLVNVVFGGVLLPLLTHRGQDPAQHIRVHGCHKLADRK